MGVRMHEEPIARYRKGKVRPSRIRGNRDRKSRIMSTWYPVATLWHCTKIYSPFALEPLFANDATVWAKPNTEVKRIVRQLPQADSEIYEL